MKKRNLIITLMLTLALCATSIASVFAINQTYPGTDGATPKMESLQKLDGASQEKDVEKFATQYAKEAVIGGYTPCNTADLQGYIKAGKVVIIDTMPAGAFKNIHIKGAFCVEAPMVDQANPKNWNPTAPDYKADPTHPEKYTAAFDDFMKTYATKKFYNSKTKKWVTKQPKASQFKGKKTKYVLKKAYKDYKFVTYCGFTGCGRSHLGAQYLVKMGLKNVYRYTGGISAWYDNNGEIEGAYATAK